MTLRTPAHRRLLAVVTLVFSLARPAFAQETPPAADAATPATREATDAPAPYGANLFTGNYAAQRENGINEGYEVLSGDRVMVNAWGAVTVNDVFPVDTQGNIFIPSVGPIHLAGVEVGRLTATVEAAIGRVYHGNFGVYTNLLTASPVAVFVTGGVRRPGRYAGIPSDSVLFFLAQSGGIDPDRGSYRDIEVIRQGQSIASCDLYDFLIRGTIATPQFEDGDTILVGRRGPVVEVHRPGHPAVNVELPADEPATGEEILRVVSFGPRVTSATLRGLRGGQSTVRTLSTQVVQETVLQDGDVLSFRADSQPDQIVVHLEGEFEGPAELAVARGTRLLDLLNHVPVDPTLSATESVYLRRESERQEQRRALRESLDRLERTTMLALSDTTNESQIRVREAELVRQFAERARNIEPLGRIPTSTSGRQLNVLLQDDDVIVIPPRTNSVRVVGEVNVPHSVQYRPDLNVYNYVRMSGDYSARADRTRVLIVRANAEIVVGDYETPVFPGDEIMIPPSIDDKWVQNGIDLAQVIYQLAVAASVVVRTGL